LKPIGWRVWQQLTQAHVHTYRLSGGRVGGTFRGSPVCLVDHVGRKSGKQRTSPLIYARSGDDIVIVASKGGSRKHPLWWLNLKEHPETTVQVGSEKRAVRARQATPAEKEGLWPVVVGVHAPYEEYQRKTERDIPVIILERT
jgi:deazaflavin-dependent oxidoreductase (nitroreductase family)